LFCCLCSYVIGNGEDRPNNSIEPTRALSGARGSSPALGYMKPTVLLSGILMALNCCLAADPPAPVGILGLPEGTVMTVEGVRPEKPLKGNLLAVQKVDGRSLKEPILITIHNIRSLPPKMILKGFEKTEWAEPCKGCQDPGGHAIHWFVVIEVISPEGLKPEHSQFLEKKKS
jgi:hypothetical protein